MVVYSKKSQNPHYIQTLKIGLFEPFVVYSHFMKNSHYKNGQKYSAANVNFSYMQ